MHDTISNPKTSRNNSVDAGVARLLRKDALLRRGDPMRQCLQRRDLGVVAQRCGIAITPLQRPPIAPTAVVYHSHQRRVRSLLVITEMMLFPPVERDAVQIEMECVWKEVA